MKDIFVIIPTLDPNEQVMENFINELRKDFKNIIVVNDGCKSEYEKFFKKLENKKIIVLKNNVNLGKGMALKHAFNYILNEQPKCKGIVSADCDAQYTAVDIKKCAEVVLKNPESLVLGSRDFTNPSIPKRRKFGNKLTKFAMEEFVDISLKDNLTGLRGMSYDLIKTFIQTTGERYEFDNNELILSKEKNINIIEVPIEAVKVTTKVDTHFDLINDTMKVVNTFSKYITRLALVLVLNLMIFNVILRFVTLPSIITITLAIVISNLICNRLIKMKKVDIVNHIVYITMLVILTLILTSITNISATICYIICMLLSYLSLRIFFE